ncbi:S-adenosylmethionine mitochondrial carrier protein homolog isoform X1 [Schistocerca nitens]|uniref:S-adenosylmethionine mitochondrial carrier protein homolog isoform X1 n=2 Tax=Schistocerca nitens TaxID=7011 RepID=UPI0021180A33|nr:S-adenosylmethionine mitochondrial carrier protein homolog isoform X1 [Schistocerca nitens]
MEQPLIISLIAGGLAGLAVDITLFPLDTLKTRLQSANGFWRSGGFRHVYKGLGPTMIGSAPTASLFFGTYNTFKSICRPYASEAYYPLVHMGAASVAEVVSCLVKVPTEIFKQRQQASTQNSSLLSMWRHIYAKEGFMGFYRGFTSTVVREIPFSVVQFPIWEFFKLSLREIKGDELNPAEKALCGAFAGCIAAAVTTPLDVVKTRIMLADKELQVPEDYKKLKISRVLRNVYSERGFKGLFAGFLPRITWITLGGAVFFGSYEVAVDVSSYMLKQNEVID